MDHPFLRPSSIHDPRALEEQAEDFLYFASVRFVKQASAGALAGVRAAARPEGLAQVAGCMRQGAGRLRLCLHV